MNKRDVGIIGNGFVGSAVISGFSLHTNIRIYDIDPNKATHSLQDVINLSKFVFVSVPTPMKDALGGAIDTTILDSVLKQISQLNKREDNIFIIKSTVIPGTVERLVERYPHLNIVYSPEFLTERSARLDFINASRVILGGKNHLLEEIEQLFRIRFPYLRIIKTDITTAQFIKYMANCFFATKVSFVNEMKQGADALGIEWHDVMHGFVSDGRIGNSHLDVPGHDGHNGFGGKCFPKDLNAFIALFEDINIEPTVMRAVWEKNLEVRDEYDWKHINGAVSEDS
jgi:UDPglucose 6-dehydrogenase